MKRDDPKNLLTRDLSESSERANAKRKKERRGAWFMSQRHEGVPLLCAWLAEEARRRAQTLSECAADLGVTSGYLNQLRTGVRSAGHVSGDFARACASYIGVPPILALIAGGVVRPSDFGLLDDEAAALQRALNRMTSHCSRPPFSDDEIAAAPPTVQRWVVERFGEVVGEDMFSRPKLPAVLDVLRVPAMRLALAAAEGGHPSDAALAKEAVTPDPKPRT
jgi:hypothetical protein